MCERENMVKEKELRREKFGRRRNGREKNGEKWEVTEKLGKEMRKR